MDTIFTFDWLKVYPDVMEALQSGKAILRDGVAYWAETSGKSGIAQHMPLKQLPFDPASLNDVTQLIKSAQAAQFAAIGLSTGIIVGAIVIQTMYLANKIEKLQESIDIISADINAQNAIFYMEKLSKYFGVVESARVLLLDRALVSETEEIAAHLIAQLGNERNEVLALIDNLIAYADKLNDRHLEQLLDFITMVLDVLPKAIYIESQLCDRYGKFRLAEHLMRENGKRYGITLNHYRNWCNQKAKRAIAGHSDPEALAFHNKRTDLKQLFQSEDNAVLLAPLKSFALDNTMARIK
ncbi:hypothetical protein [Pseudescherichia sp.]|uniref:hypothetical protein n=1 Tax=Pseudescherichia sp. TaxID=2055881 RepID=UPI00289EC564|nr:hypothetical protein [Pseudescherichia sp.]